MRLPPSDVLFEVAIALGLISGVLFIAILLRRAAQRQAWYNAVAERLKRDKSLE